MTDLIVAVIAAGLLSLGTSFLMAGLKIVRMTDQEYRDYVND